LYQGQPLDFSFPVYRITKMKIHLFAKYPDYRIKEVEGFFYLEYYICGMFGRKYWSNIHSIPYGVNSYDATYAILLSIVTPESEAEIIQH